MGSDVDRPDDPLTASARSLVVFCVDGQRHALPLPAVERVVSAVEVTPLPGAPRPVLGAIDVGGRVLPVFSLRRRLGLADRALQVSDYFVLARTSRRPVALVVDEVQAVRTCEAGVIDAALLAASAQPMPDVVRLDDGLLLIHDLETFLSPRDDQALEDAMGRTA
jgi:purine-binding chemotaxis protein CheW